jgi:hypothetical protein
MILPSFFLLGLIASTAQGAPLTKRVAQVIVESTAKWEQACLAAGGGQQCNPVSVAAFSTLLAAAGPCDQQNAADKMVDLAKTLGNDAKMISLSQIFAQQPRNSPSSQSVPYCQQAPKNTELTGLFQCQFQGVNPKVFVGGVPVGQAGTIPFGKGAPLNPAGSCQANPNGPIADGTQLVNLTQNPGAGGGAPPKPAPGTPAKPSVTANKATASPASTNAPAAGGGFKLQNGKDAQALNAKFATLNANSPCTDGDSACIGTNFAQCVGGKFVTTPCATTLTCAALPLVNKPGTSITCTTEADAAARIAATGATGGVTGSNGGGGGAAPPSSPKLNTTPPANTNNAPAAGGFKLRNGKDAQSLNAKFATLSANSECKDGDEACIGSAFAQCVGGKFVTTSCGSTLTCAALPLVNKPGTSITCTTQADAAARITATGATGGITGA